MIVYIPQSSRECTRYPHQSCSVDMPSGFISGGRDIDVEPASEKLRDKCSSLWTISGIVPCRFVRMLSEPAARCLKLSTACVACIVGAQGRQHNVSIMSAIDWHIGSL